MARHLAGAVSAHAVGERHDPDFGSHDNAVFIELA
jgi:hypothetical protein